jgi:membrane-bound lytic murein transglycosylase
MRAAAVFAEFIDIMPDGPSMVVKAQYEARLNHNDANNIRFIITIYGMKQPLLDIVRRKKTSNAYKYAESQDGFS